ncbi:MAG: hypothetical protein HY820_44995 [Acidobacteria bacterium]|nr:hypothetical protein [Acidobacteriota bacterium]
MGVMLPWAEARKLTDDERLEILRGMSAEYATLKVSLPRSKKPLAIASDGTYEKDKWEEASKEYGPAGRVGDLVQITKVTIEADKLVFEINGGLKTGPKWYERVEVGMGSSGRTIGQGNTKLGSTISLNFPKGVPPLAASEIKKILLPVMDFEKRSATEQFITTLPPEIAKALKEQRVVEGMDRETVMLAVGRPRAKSRETKDGVDLEDWVYGLPPGKITFVTFQGNKVVKVKDTYAGLGGSTATPLPPN